MVALFVVLTLAVAVTIDAMKVRVAHHDETHRHTIGIHSKPHHVGS